ncbi:MAG: sugar ABC transporter substrate-binding protein [Acidimicrobiia bacterium]
MNRLHLRLFALVFALVMVVAACGGGDDEPEGTTAAPEASTTTAPEATTTTAAAATTTVAALAPLTIWADDKFGPIIEEVAAPFTTETGVPIEVTVIDFEDMREQIVTQAPAGQGPDIFIGAHDWVGEMVANGIAAPIDLGDKAANLTEPSLNALTVEGTLYALPYAAENVTLYYNTELVPTPPASVEELTAICDQLGDDIENCWGITGGGAAGDAYHNYAFVSAQGGYIFGYTPETGFDVADVGLDSEGAIAGVEALATLVADGYIAPLDDDTAKQLFIDGTEPFYLSGPWQINSLNESGMPWSAAPLPTLDGNVMAPFIGVRGFYISEFGSNPAIAQEFLLNFIATDETMVALHEADPRGPTWLPVLEAIGDDPVFSAFGASGASGQFMPNVPEMGAVWGPLGDQLLAIRQGSTDATTAMTQAAEQVRTAVAGG